MQLVWLMLLAVNIGAAGLWWWVSPSGSPDPFVNQVVPLVAMVIFLVALFARGRLSEALLPPVLAVAWALGRMLGALALGEATASSLGLPLPAMRAALVGVLGLATGAAVAQTGLIAFVGLAAPHMVRTLAPAPLGRLVLLAALMGGVLLMAADVLARWLVAPQELPVGVLTAVLGGTYLLWLMHRRGRPGGLA